MIKTTVKSSKLVFCTYLSHFSTVLDVFFSGQPVISSTLSSRVRVPVSFPTPRGWPMPLPNFESENRTYQCLYKCNGSHRKFIIIILQKLWMYNTIIIFILEPNLVDNSLYDRRTKYPHFLNRILDVNCQQQYNLNITAITVHLVNEAITFQ